MAATAARFIACAGLLAAGIFVGGLGSGVAVADTTDSSSTGTEGSTSVGDNSGASGGSESTPDEKPTSTVGSGREDTNTDGGVATKTNTSLSIPVLRWPTPDEVHKTGVTAFVGTVDVPVPDLQTLLQPEPEPTPTPSFRTQEEEAPSVDAGGGGSDMLSATGGEPPVLQAPLVAAPLPVPGLPSAPVAPIGASAGAPGQPMMSAAPAGAKPSPMEPLPEVAGPATQTSALIPMSGSPTRAGFSRYFRNPTLGDLAAFALPGLVGLFLVTFSGSVLGYRQANSVRFIRTQGAERFLR